ncbi:helix-turn-helix domain-containing protein [Lactimicrobium massiliense]|uniref:helix-turn-helix domain-containing protein n=1 Tax=Lactimicrobium massiliense TaxID=2161814 RepID=UPI003CCA23E2
MYCHHHLTLEEREQIMKYLVLRKTVTEIATELHRSKSTISREIKRNSSDSEYRPSVAEYSGHPRASVPDLQGRLSGVSRPGKNYQSISAPKSCVPEL